MLTTSSISNVQNSCEFILKNIRSSSLNYAVQETPFSLYLTIRKSFVKNKTRSDSKPATSSPLVRETEISREELETLKVECESLKNENQTLKKGYEEAIIECEENNMVIADLQNRNENLDFKVCKCEAKIKELDDEKKKLQAKNEKLNEENKSLKLGRENFNKEVNNLSNSLKASKKEIKEVNYRLEKKACELEYKVKEFIEFKATKTIEEKELKNKIKKIDKK